MSTRVELHTCETCGSSDTDALGRTRGERLLAQLRLVQSELTEAEPRGEDSQVDVALLGVRCLWSCKRGCSVHLRSEGRVGYVLGDFDDSAEGARGLLAYARAYGQSEDGAVPFKQWPQAVRGHFVCRIPVTTLPSSTPTPAEPDLRSADSSPKESP